jgi:hypothetical protein
LLHKHWEHKDRPEEIDRDFRFMVFTSLEIYMSGRKPPPPRPLQEVLREMRSGGPLPQHPTELFSVYAWLARRQHATERCETD